VLFLKYVISNARLKLELQSIVAIAVSISLESLGFCHGVSDSVGGTLLAGGRQKSWHFWSRHF